MSDSAETQDRKYFRVYDLRKATYGADRNNLSAYLWQLHHRFHNGIHAETRVYTCRSWRDSAGSTRPYELHWNDQIVPGEVFLGSFGWAVGQELIGQIEAEFARGEAVRLFIFNSDADLCFEEILAPIAGYARTAVD